MSFKESAARAKAADARREMAFLFREAFKEDEMAINASLIVWTKGQMRGIRAVLLRTRGA